MYSLFEFNDLEISFFVWACSQVIFNRFLNRNFNVWDFQIEVFAKDVLQKSTFHINRFSQISESKFAFFESLGSRFSGFLGLENRLGNGGIFVMQPDPEMLNWGW